MKIGIIIDERGVIWTPNLIEPCTNYEKRRWKFTCRLYYSTWEGFALENLIGVGTQETHSKHKITPVVQPQAQVPAEQVKGDGSS